MIQSSRKKGSEFVQEFVRALPDSFQSTSRLARRANTAASSKVLQSIQRLLSIWSERKIFDSSVIEDLKLRLTSTDTPLTPVTTERERVNDTWQQAEQFTRAAQSLASRAQVRAELLSGEVLARVRSKDEVETAARDLDSSAKLCEEWQGSTQRAVDAQHKLLAVLREALQRQEEHTAALESQLNECKHRSDMLTRVKLKMQQMHATLPSGADTAVKAIVMQSASDLGASHVAALEDELAMTNSASSGHRTDPFDIYFNPSDDTAPNSLPLYSYESYGGYEDMLAPGTSNNYSASGAATEFSADPPYYP